MSMPSAAGRSGGGRTYVFGQHGGSDSTGKGVFLLKPGCGADVWSPSFADKAFMTVRLMPVRNPENPAVWEPYRHSPEPNAFGDWIRHFPAIRKYGDPSVTYIYKDPRDESIDGQMTPGAVLYRAVKARVDARTDPGWGGYLNGGQGRSALLSKPSDVFLMQCVIVAMNGEPKMLGANANDPVIVLSLSSGVGKSLVEQLNRIREGYAGDMLDYPNAFAAGDPVSLHNGAFVTFYRKGDGDPRTRGNAMGGQQQMLQIGGQRPAFGSGGGGGRSEIGFDCFVEPTYGGMSANWSSHDAFFASRAKAWDDILYFPTVQEQAKLLADKFPAEMITYAWREHPDWIPESVQRAAIAAHSVAMGGFGMPGGNPQFPQQGFPQQGFPQQGFGQTPFGAPPMGAPIPPTMQFGGAQPAPGMFGAPAAPTGPAPGMPGMPQMPPMGGAPFGAPQGPAFGAPQAPAFGAPAGQPPFGAAPGFSGPPAQQGFPPAAGVPFMSHPVGQSPFGQQPQQPQGAPPMQFGGGFTPPPAAGAPPMMPPQHEPTQPAFAPPPGFGGPPAGFGAPGMPGMPGQPQQPQFPAQPGQPGQAAAAPAWLGAGNSVAPPLGTPTGPAQPTMPQQPQQQYPAQPQQQYPAQPQQQYPAQPQQPQQQAYPAQPDPSNPMAALMAARDAMGRTS